MTLGIALLAHLCVLNPDVHNPKYETCFVHEVTPSHAMTMQECNEIGMEIQNEPHRLDHYPGRIGIIVRFKCAPMREANLHFKGVPRGIP